MDDRVGIIGYECFSPLGMTFASTWKELIGNRSGVRFIDRYDPSRESLQGVSSIAFAGQIPVTYAEMAGSRERFDRSPEPSSHCARMVCKNVLDAIKLDVSRHDPQRIGIIGATALTAQISQHVLSTTAKPYVNFILNQCHNIPLAMVAKEFGLRGPSFSIGGACASGNHALFMAHHFIRTGLLDGALVVGFEFPLLPLCVGGFEWLHALYKRDKPDDRGYHRPELASRPFSRDRRGFVLAEAVGAVFLSRVDHAQRVGWTVKGLIEGGYMNSDGDHLTRMSPGNIAVCMRAAIRAAGRTADEIDCINAHATSTPVGDAAELTGLYEVFGERLTRIPVVANKSQLGHSLGASALLELMLAVEGMNTGIVLPTLNHVPDPGLPDAFVPTSAMAHEHRATLMNSFGFGGTNASLVVSGMTD